MRDLIVDFWRKKEIKTAAELEAVLENVIIGFSYNSGKIENDRISYYDTREIFQNDRISNYTGDLRTLFEIRNAKDAYQVMLDAFEKKRELDLELIKQFQYELTKNTYDQRRWDIGERPGELKKHDYVVGKEEVGSSPEEAETDLKTLLDELKYVPEKELITAAAYFHAVFEQIHPFADGNGRTGRLAMNYYLVCNDHPPIVIHEEDRKEYYSALESWDKDEDLIQMVEFLGEQLEKTWMKSIEREKRFNNKIETAEKNEKTERLKKKLERER